MGLFSMLFGVGVLLYADKPTETGKPPRSLWFRRMALLLVIGLIHAYGVAALMLVIGSFLVVGPGLSWDSMPEADRAKEAEMMMPTRAYLDVWNYVGAVFASIGYAAALILVVKRQALPALRRALAAVGQTALSNYLFHSILTSVVFLGYGLGFAGRLDYAGQLLFVAAVWLVQLVVSPLWLARFRFGPAEWLWRSLTYGRLQPMLRS